MKRNCDGCGKVIPGDAIESDYPDLAIYIGDCETPAYEYEDLCPTCRDKLICAIENALIDCDIVEDRGPDIAPGNAISDSNPDKQDDDTEIPPAVDVVDDALSEPAQADNKTYANGIVKQFPIKPMYSANR